MGSQPDPKEPAMNARADFDAFADVVRDAETDLRNAARRYTDDATEAEELMFAAATRLASRWRSAAFDDPRRQLLQAVEDPHRHEWPGIDTAGRAPRDIGRLIDAAWLAGRRVRRRRHRRTGMFLLVVTVIIALFAWAVNVSSVDAENGEEYDAAIDAPSTVTVLDSHTVALPAPDVIARTPFLQSVLPSDLDVVASQAPPVSGSDIDSIAIVFGSDSYWPVMVTPDGLARGTDLSPVATAPDRVRLWPRSVSPDGQRFAAGVDSTIVIVDRSGDIETIPSPADAGVLLDVAWSPDGGGVQASFEMGTWVLTADDAVPVDWYGLATTFHPDTGRPVEFTASPSSEIAIRLWEDGEPAPPLTSEASPPIMSWSGAPMADTGRYVRGCDSAPEATVAGNPMPWCVAVLSAQAELEWFLLAGDHYTDVTVLGARNGEVLLAVRSTSDMADQRILQWRLSDHRLLHLTTVTDDASVAMGTW